MKRTALTLTLVIALLFSFLFCQVLVQPSRASSKTITVPDDYPTIQEAIGNATAGDTVFVRSGTYDETLTIDKSISLIGENSSTTIITAPNVTNIGISQGLTTIQVNADNVNVSNLTINNHNAMGLGIATSGNETQIIGNTVNAEIAVFTNGAFTNINENTISGYFTGVLCGLSTNSNIITNNDILLSHSYGIELERSFFNIVWGNKIVGFAGYGVFINGDSNNATGNTVTGTSDGISVFLGSFNIVTENSVTNCTDIGLRIDHGLNNTFSGNGVAECKYGVGIGEAAYNNTIYRNNIINNVQQASTSNVSNYWDNGKEGNYWSDYLTEYPNATEIDSTGIGNTPYLIDANNIDNHPLMKPVAIPEFPTATIATVCLLAAATILVAVRLKKKAPS